MKKISTPFTSSLVKTRIFTLRDLWLFLVGILFVSMTSGAIGAFMYGVRDEEFFIGDADDILVVSQPGITTPFTGKVPEHLQKDIQKIDGVLKISPETLGLSIAQNLDDRSMVVRGITKNFTELTPITVIEGKWFNTDIGFSNNTQINGAVIGHLLAADLGLSYGTKIQLASTLTNVVVELVITGIIQSNNPSDEELLVPLSLGKTMAGIDASFVSFIRVLINDEIITKESLSSIINSEYSVPISLLTQDPELRDSLVGTPVVAYTPFGAHVQTQFIRDGNITEFQLRFGTYEFIATPAGVPNSPTLTLFVNQSFNDAFIMEIYGVHNDLQLNVTYNNNPAKNASIILQERFRPEQQQYSQTNEEGLAQFSDLYNGFYKIIISYQGLTNTTLIRLTKSDQLDIKLISSLSLTILNISSGLEVQGAEVRVLTKTDSQVVNYTNYYLSGDPIFLDPNEYLVEVTYEGLKREFSTVINVPTSRIIHVGAAVLRVLTRGEDGQSLSSTLVNVSGAYASLNQTTDSNGYCNFLLDAGLQYNVTAIPAANQSRGQILDFSFENVTLLTFDFLDIYSLDVSVINGSAINNLNNALPNSNVSLFKESVLVNSTISNDFGKVSFNLTKPGIYQITAEKDGFLWNRTLHIRFNHTQYTIRLGKVSFLVSTQTVSGFPISGSNISLVSENDLEFQDVTNSTGQIEFSLPIGTHFLRIIKNGFEYEENITFTESQRVSFVQIIELSGNLTLSLTNQFSQKISKAFVISANNHYNIEYRGFTNSKGEITFNITPWGNYSFQITYYDEAFPKTVLDFAQEVRLLSIQIETKNPVLSPGDFKQWQSSSFSVVLSSDFVSEFLQGSLTVFMTAFTSLVIIISVLSLLSIASVISHPIVSNEKTLITFQQLGATRNQVTIGIVTQLSFIGAMTSTGGTFLGMVIMTYFPTFQSVNIGGVIIRPSLDILLLILIVLTNTAVIIFKSGQKVQELYNIR
ncbi:MAG: ABC transporter permease [Candidatus Hodarchaeales archaeon]